MSEEAMAEKTIAEEIEDLTSGEPIIVCRVKGTFGDWEGAWMRAETEEEAKDRYPYYDQLLSWDIVRPHLNIVPPMSEGGDDVGYDLLAWSKNWVVVSTEHCADETGGWGYGLYVEYISAPRNPESAEKCEGLTAG